MAALPAPTMATFIYYMYIYQFCPISPVPSGVPSIQRAFPWL